MSTAVRQGAPEFPTLTGSITHTDQAAMDAAIAELQGHKDSWVATTSGERVALLDELIRDCAPLAPRWVAASLEAKGLAPDAPAAAEEWSAGPYSIVRNLRLLRRSLADLAAGRKPRIPGPVRTRPDGQVTAQVFPQ